MVALGTREEREVFGPETAKDLDFLTLMIENMTNGFYDTDDMADPDIEGFMRDALKKAYNMSCQRIVGMQRQVVRDVGFEGMLKEIMGDEDRVLYVVDRFAHADGAFKKEQCEFEICLNGGSSFLYVFVPEKDFKKLVKMWGLELKEWN